MLLFIKAKISLQISIIFLAVVLLFSLSGCQNTVLGGNEIIDSESSELVEFYAEVIDELHSKSDGLNSNISLLALDLTEVPNLSEDQKEDLAYLVSETYETDTVLCTYEDLVVKGYIDEDELYFEDGLLYTLKVTDAKENSFTFDIQKWRGGLGAYFFTDCKAQYKSSSWKFEIGNEAIS